MSSPFDFGTDIKAALNCLIGTQLTVIGYAASMRTIGFGERREAFNARGKATIQTPYSLHVQAPWKLTREKILLTGSDDWWIPLDRSDNPDWKPEQGGSVQESVLRSVFGDTDHSRRVLLNKTQDLVVSHWTLSPSFELNLHLSPNYEITIVPDGSVSEHWRLMHTDGTDDFVNEGVRIYKVSLKTAP